MNVFKPENNYLIVDEHYYNELKEKAELNEAKIEELTTEKYLKAIKESGVELSYQINGIPQIFHRDLIDELNYDERGLPESVLEKVKYAIADDITDYLNKRFAHWKDDCETYASNIWKQNRQHLESTSKFWKNVCLFLFFVLFVAIASLIMQHFYG